MCCFLFFFTLVTKQKVLPTQGFSIEWSARCLQKMLLCDMVLLFSRANLECVNTVDGEISIYNCTPPSISHSLCGLFSGRWLAQLLLQKLASVTIITVQLAWLWYANPTALPQRVSKVCDNVKVDHYHASLYKTSHIHISVLYWSSLVLICWCTVTGSYKCKILIWSPCSRRTYIFVVWKGFWCFYFPVWNFRLV